MKSRGSRPRSSVTWRTVLAIAEVATAVTKGDLTRSIKVEALGDTGTRDGRHLDRQLFEQVEDLAGLGSRADRQLPSPLSSHHLSP